MLITRGKTLFFHFDFKFMFFKYTSPLLNKCQRICITGFVSGKSFASASSVRFSRDFMCTDSVFWFENLFSQTEHRHDSSGSTSWIRRELFLTNRTHNRVFHFNNGSMNNSEQLAVTEKKIDKIVRTRRRSITDAINSGAGKLTGTQSYNIKAPLSPRT